jgi:hypothetical protein
MITFKNAMMIRTGALGVGLAWLLAGCADKALLSPAGGGSHRVTLRVSATLTAQQAPSWLLVAALYREGDSDEPLGIKFVPVQTGTIPVSLEVDIAPCTASNARQGKPGCTMYLAAMIVPDTMAAYDPNRDVVSEAYDSALPIGPFEVAPGRTVIIPPIDLSLTRFAAVQWTGDNALSPGGVYAPTTVAPGVVGETAPISAVAGSGTTATVFALTRGFIFSSDLNVPPANVPQLAIFENSAWTRVNGPADTPVNGSNNYTDVTALARDNVLLTSSTGLYRYNGSTISRVTAVTAPLYAIASTVVSGAGSVAIVGGEGGTVWLGNTQTWQPFVINGAGRITNVCITGPNEAFAHTSTGAIFRYDGSAWTNTAHPLTGVKLDLACPVAGQAYVMTFSGVGYRWSNGRWTELPTTGVSGFRQLHWSVVSANEIYAYGDSLGINRVYYRFNGTSWTTISRSRFSSTSSRPVMVNGSAYVVGIGGRLERVNASGMNVLSYQPSWRGVAVNSATSAFAVGFPSVLVRWNGSQWIADAPPANLPNTRMLQGVWSDGPGNAWAVGEKSTVLRFTGASWVAMSDSLLPAGVRDQYNGVWGSGTTTWTVGDASILRCTATACANEAAPAGGALHGIWGASPTAIFAVGENGRILRSNGSAWTVMTSPTTRTLARVSGSSATDVWALGDSVLLRFDGTQWTNVPMTGELDRLRSPATTVAMRANFAVFPGAVGPGLWVRGPREVYISGQYGDIARFDGFGWAQISSGSPRHFVTALHGTSGNGGCALAVTESNFSVPAPTFWRGVGPTGCFAGSMIAPSNWP